MPAVLHCSPVTPPPTELTQRAQGSTARDSHPTWHPSSGEQGWSSWCVYKICIWVLILPIPIARNPRDQRAATQWPCQAPMLTLGRGFSRPCAHPQREADGPNTALWKHFGGSMSKLLSSCFDILALLHLHGFWLSWDCQVPTSLEPLKGRLDGNLV